VAPRFHPRLEALEDRCLPSFVAPVTYPAGEGIRAIATGDFNGDGKKDIATTTIDSEGGPSYVNVMLAASHNSHYGDGKFAPPVDYPVGPFAYSLAVADFNRDGRPDIVAGTADSISVLDNKGDGTFIMPALDYGSGAVSVAVGDFNGDGRPDIVTANGSTGSYGMVSVLLAAQDWPIGFGPAQDYPIASAQGVAVGDFNGDGKLDVVVASGLSDTAVVLLGNGDGTLQPAQGYYAGPGLYGDMGMVVSDFNGDGKLDLVMGSSSWTTVTLLLGNGDGTFGAARNVGPGGTVAAADFNHDGKLDIVSVNSQSTYVDLGNGDGTFQAALKVGPGGKSVAVDDFNGDGFADLAVAGPGSVDVFRNAADWTGHQKK